MPKDHLQYGTPIDLSPARWIWFPSDRTLPNTCVFFRKEIHIKSAVTSATGWIVADSRYVLSVNGQRVQWGPTPGGEPRHMEADPVDVTPYLHVGDNVLGTHVLFFGNGEGTWVAGKPGLLVALHITYADGSREEYVSDHTWKTIVDRSHRPGQYPRWLLRAMQEEIDMRLYPHGWNTVGYEADSTWIDAYEIPGRGDKPSGCLAYGDYLHDFHITDTAGSDLRQRYTPMLKEQVIPAKGLTESGTVCWKRNHMDWFEFRTPDSFTIDKNPVACQTDDGWELPATQGTKGVYAIFEMPEEMTGFPYVTLDAGQDTTIELMWCEAHDSNNAPWLDTTYYHWARLICAEGFNAFELFDYEGLKWLQVHVTNARRPVTITSTGVRRRLYDWPHTPAVTCGEPDIQRLLGACFNTLDNLAQGTLAADAGRERQQYGQDGSRPLYAIRYAYGDAQLSTRFLFTFGKGMTENGYYLDTWPASDRLGRITYKQIGGTFWSPVLDASLYFYMDCYDHYMYTGDRAALCGQYDGLKRAMTYFTGLQGQDGLLPVENIGIPMVWIDHFAYINHREKQCAFNLLAAGMFLRMLPEIARICGDEAFAKASHRFGQSLWEAAVKRFYDKEKRLFVNNLPWVSEDGLYRTDDMSLGFAVYFDLCPGDDVQPSLDMLQGCPPEMGRSFTSNWNWRYWALAKHGRTTSFVRELKEVWAVMPSVLYNNTLAEIFDPKFDSHDDWSHSPVIPLYCMYTDLLGVKPLAPGCKTMQIKPQLGGMGDMNVDIHIPQGAIGFAAVRGACGYHITVAVPQGCEVVLVLDGTAMVDMAPAMVDADGLRKFRVSGGQEVAADIGLG